MTVKAAAAKKAPAPAVGDSLLKPFTEDEAVKFANVHSLDLLPVENGEYGSEKAAVEALRKVTTKEHILVRGSGDNDGKFVLVHTPFKAKPSMKAKGTAIAKAKPASKPVAVAEDSGATDGTAEDGPTEGAEE